MGWVEALQRAINYMEEHLLEDISIESIAKQANFSTFHFQRTFTVLTDCSVGEYIRRRRLTLAAQELISTESKIIDLAFKYGYDTPEAFTKAFRRQHGVTPSEVRNHIGELHSYNRLSIQVSLKGVEPMKYRIVEKEAFQVVGVKREFSCVNGENLIGIPKMWQEVHENGVNARLGSLNNGAVEGILGVCVDIRDTRPEMIDYWIATAYVGDVPEGFLRLEVPAAKWAIFEVHGAMPDAMQETWKKIYSEWYPSSGYEHANAPELEVYPNENPYTQDYYSEIWIPVK